jgi:serine/threonine protein phosphatase PrpC
LIIPRPLHYIATFDRGDSLGLLLSEVDTNGEYDDDLNEEDTAAWIKATKNALPGEVYVRGVVEGGQAEKIGVFEVGDRLMGVGEFPFIAEGFNVVLEMLQRQPPSAKTVTLHFDRKSIGRQHAYERTAPHLAKVVGQGAWSARGRRKTQEDRLILQEIHDGENAALLTGVFDGHGGDSASTTLAQLLPSLFSVELAGILSNERTDGKATSADLREAMESAYEITCRTYRDGCDAEGLCTADYDPREGIVVAGTAATDLIAGSTVATAVLSVTEDGADVLNVLNCGDSRTLVVGRPRGGLPKDSTVHFSTRDHSPSCEIEMERLARGEDKGYSQPKCSMSRWRIKVGGKFLDQLLFCASLPVLVIFNYFVRQSLYRIIISCCIFPARYIHRLSVCPGTELRGIIRYLDGHCIRS